MLDNLCTRYTSFQTSAPEPLHQNLCTRIGAEVVQMGKSGKNSKSLLKIKLEGVIRPYLRV